MINANELRIGNWVSHNANWCFRSPSEIKPFNFQWEERDWYALGESTMDLQDCHPIPLSPEILEKCGFLKTDDGISKYWRMVRNRTEVISIEDDGSFGLNAEYESSKQGYASYPDLCKYLHQLQNLYFALTGEELTITL